MIFYWSYYNQINQKAKLLLLLWVLMIVSSSESLLWNLSDFLKKKIPTSKFCIWDFRTNLKILMQLIEETKNNFLSFDVLFAKIGWMWKTQRESVSKRCNFSCVFSHTQQIYYRLHALFIIHLHFLSGYKYLDFIKIFRLYLYIVHFNSYFLTFWIIGMCFLYIYIFK